MKLAKAFGPVILALALSLTTQGCSFFFGDPYGDQWQKTEAWVDLRTELQTASGTVLDQLSGIAVLEGASGSYAFLQGNFQDQTSRLFALEYGSLSLLNFQAYSSGGTLSSSFDALGDIRIGSQSYLPGSLFLNEQLPLTYPWIGAWLVSDGTLNYFLYSSANILHADAFTTTWAPVSTTSWQIGSSSESWDIARVAMLSNQRLCLLFSQSNRQGTIVAAVFKDLASFVTAAAAGGGFILESADASVGSRISGYSSNGVGSPSGVDAWITEAGIVARTNTNGSNSNSFSFVRYPLGPGGQIDGYWFDSNYKDLVYFEPSGNCMYYFDLGSGRLFRMRTWW